MNYKLIKRSYQILVVIGICLSILSIVFVDEILDTVSANLIVIISASLCVPIFVLKLLHEQEYPPSKNQKIIGVIITVLGLIAVFSV